MSESMPGTAPEVFAPHEAPVSPPQASEEVEFVQLLTPEGELHRFVNVYLNGQDVRYLAGLETPVGERDEIRLLPAIAGG